MLLFLPAWIVGWAFGEASAIAALTGFHQISKSPMSPMPTGFLLLWLTFWTLGGALAITAFAWNAFGRETVEVAGRTLRIGKHALGMGRTREYDLEHVRNLRVSPAPLHAFSFTGSMRYWGFGNGIVAFDYGASTIRVLGGIDEGEASILVTELKERLGTG